MCVCLESIEKSGETHKKVVTVIFRKWSQGEGGKYTFPLRFYYSFHLSSFLSCEYIVFKTQWVSLAGLLSEFQRLCPSIPEWFRSTCDHLPGLDIDALELSVNHLLWKSQEVSCLPCALRPRPCVSSRYVLCICCSLGPHLARAQRRCRQRHPSAVTAAAAPWAGSPRAWAVVSSSQRCSPWNRLEERHDGCFSHCLSGRTHR